MKVTKVPAKAQSIEQILDILLQILNVIEAFLRIFGIDLSELFGNTDPA